MIALKRAIQELPILEEGEALEIIDAMRYRMPQTDLAEQILTVAADKLQTLIERQKEADGDGRKRIERWEA